MPRAAKASRMLGGKASPETKALVKDTRHAELVRLVEQDAQEGRRADVGVGLQVGDRRELLLGLADAGGKDGAAERVRGGLHHRAGGREVVREGVVHQVAGTETRGEQRARQAVVVGARAFGFVERAGRGEHAPARRAPAHRREAAEGPRRLLQLEQFRLARDRQRGERLAAGHRIRIDVGEQPPERGRGGARMGDLRRQAASSSRSRASGSRVSRVSWKFISAPLLDALSGDVAACGVQLSQRLRRR
jgi:hypothetical protein